MDLTTFTVALVAMFSLLAVDSVLHSGAVAVEVSAPSSVYSWVIDEHSLEEAFTAELDNIAATVSMVNPPEILSSHDAGLAMTLADAVKLKSLAFSVERQFGYIPDHLHLGLFLENGILHGNIDGYGHSVGGFVHEFVRDKDETLLHFIQRCSLWGASQLAPYSTALYLLQQHTGDGEFQDVEALASHSLEALPPAPVNQHRAMFENLLGLVALFRQDSHQAQAHFLAAVAAWPDAPVPILNLAFSEIQMDANESAAARVRALLASRPSTYPAVLATAHLTLAAALMGRHDLDGAEAELATAMAINPQSSSIPALWSELKQQRGDAAGAELLNRQALQNTTSFENFGEMAVLYFRLSWRDNEPVIRSRFSNPRVVTFH